MSDKTVFEQDFYKVEKAQYEQKYDDNKLKSDKLMEEQQKLIDKIKKKKQAAA